MKVDEFQNQEPKNTPSEECEKFDYIDALRGIAILMVIAVHAAQCSTGWSEGFTRDLVNQGARGVQLFFLMSAFTLLLSWNRRNDGIRRFYVRRIFRVAPMFWAAILLFLALQGFTSRYFAPDGIGPLHVCATALFIHGWHPETITSVVPGGWSIAAEMIFYLLFPFLIGLTRSVPSTILLLLASLLLSSLSFDLVWENRTALFPGQPDYLVSTMLQLWLPAQLPCFVCGFLLYRLLEHGYSPFSRRTVSWGLILVAFLLFALMAIRNRDIDLLGLRLTVSFQSAGIFLIFVSGFRGVFGAQGVFGKVLCLFGRLSYSAYFHHFVILTLLAIGISKGLDVFQLENGKHGGSFFLWFFPVLVAATMLFSWVTYKYVEQPGIALGRKINSRF